MNSTDEAPSEAERNDRTERSRFFAADASPGSRLLALLFGATCLAAVGLTALYRWPTVNLLTCSLTPVPPFVAFGALIPVILVGAFGVRRRWLLLGLILWASGFFMTEEAVQALRPFPGRARERFIAARMGYRSYMADNENEARPASVPLRVVSWNVKGGAGLNEEGVERLASLKPDIILLQECRGDALKSALMKSNFLAEWHVDGSGEVVLSRFPFRKRTDVPMPAWRGDVWRVEPSPGRYVDCINVHLARSVLKPDFIRYWRPGRVREAITATGRRLDDLHRTIEVCAKDGPVIAAGDFNLPPYYPGVRRATAGLQDCFGVAGYGWGKTAPAGLPLYRIDMIFVSPGARVYYAGAVGGSSSDHRMMLAEVEMPLADTTPNNAAGPRPPSKVGVSPRGRATALAGVRPRRGGGLGEPSLRQRTVDAGKSDSRFPD